MNDFYWLVLGVLSVWRVTHLLQAEDGPWDASVHLRKLAGHGFFGDLLDCFYCLSLWVAAPCALWLGNGARERVLLWLGLSAGAVLLERGRHTDSPQLTSKQEDGDVMLRKETREPQPTEG